MIFVTGCGNTLKNSWLDFRAYYNTYYNAKENFRAGLKKVEQQPVTIDPTEPVRIHPPPIQAGNNDFQKAIDKGARILRKFPNSEWTDDALLLIGKSYFYRQEFYAALQKFEELRNASASPEMEQLSIIWKGWTQLDLKQYTDGVAFLEVELNRYPNNWSTEKEAEIQALAGEHHAMLEHWDQASEHLSVAVSNMENKKLLGRALFLYGQVLERQERYGEAYFTFSKVSENFPGFEYIFWARYKQADVARKEGNLDQAMAIYESLRKDDKNFQRRNELTFEIARTLEMEEEPEKAEKTYKTLLYGEEVQQRRSLKADIYYRLGRIYSDQYNDYPVAAAYFDSSSSISDVPQKIDATQDAKSLADAYGKYTRLQNSINRADSLMWLGSLSESQLDSALARIRAQKRRALIKEQRSESQNTFANRNQALSDGRQGQDVSIYGFLNHKNSRLVNQSKTEFRILWGDRPLIDNWRRIEVVRQSNVRSQPQQQVENQELMNNSDALTVEMNLDEIPRTSEDMNQLLQEKVSAQYELGNLLFLNLNLPDSARYFFHKVIESERSQELRPRAMYSLYELSKTGNDQDSLRYWEQRILEEYPNSRYAQRIQGNEEAADLGSDSSKILVQKFQSIIHSKEKHKAIKLRKLALENRSSELAPYIHYQSIESYIEEAKAHTKVAESVTAENMARDSVFSADSIQAAAITSESTFSGAHWDSVRFAIQEFETIFPDAKQQKQVAELHALLANPESFESFPTCESLGISLAIQPSMDGFLSSVKYPEELEGTSISGEVKYSFVVTKEGQVESYELVSQRTSLGIEEAFEDAFEKTLQFEALQIENPPDRVQCELSFPIQH